MIAPKLRRLLSFLKKTPLHPQWLIFKDADKQKQALAHRIHGRLLDIGCGNKPLSNFLHPSVQYIGLDYPTTVSKGYDGLADVLGDGQSLPFPANCFDCVTLLDVMEHLPQPAAAFNEMVRVAKPGGLIITQTPFMYPLHDLPHDFQRWTREGLLQLSLRHPIKLQELTHQGKPIETAAVLTNLALAKGILESTELRGIGVMLSPLVIITIPIVNITFWLIAKLLPDQGFMPLGYTAIFRKDK